MKQKLVVIGQGYVGLPMALRAVESGLDVTGLDASADVVSNLNAGRSHIDDVSDSDLADGIARGYRASTDPSVIAEADAILVCVPTPLATEAGGPDLTYVIGAAQTIGEHITPGTLAVLESTTYPGTTEEVFLPRVAAKGLVVGRDIFIAFSPERIDPGNKDYGVQNTPKVVGGVTPNCTKRAVELYESFVDQVVPAKNVRSAEMSKLIENTFRHVNIALMNEMLRFSHELDIDLWDAIDCAATKPFGYMPFRPGPGVGGHCIPVDPTYLSHRVKARLGYSFRMVELAEEINGAAPLYVASRAIDALNDRGRAAKGSRVCLLGVTYKPNIADKRESPAVPLARRLLARGVEVSYIDPFVETWNPEGGDRALNSLETLEDVRSTADIAILLQPHNQFDLEKLAALDIPILDTRGILAKSDNVMTL